MVESIQQKCTLWMDGSLFFRGILGFFNLLARFFEGSVLVQLFSADFDRERLRRSFFVRIVEDILNRFPKILRPQDETAITPAPAWLQGSFLFRFLTDAMETPITSFKWLIAAFPAWGLLAVVVGAPFLPTMMVAGMLVVVFAATLFRYNFKLDLTSIPLLLFIVITLFTGFMSPVAAYSIPIAVLTAIMMSSYLLVKACFTTRKRIDFVIAVFIIAAAVTALVGISQIYTSYMHMAWVDRDVFAALSTRIYATFANPNVYGTYLLLAIPLAAVCMLYAKNIWYKLFAAGITGLLVIALALTYSRGGYLALAATVFIFLVLVEKRLIVLFAAGVAAMPLVLPASIIGRIVSIFNFAAWDSSTIYRISIWQASLRIIGDFWMAG
ncbi:MAG: O-antigen ligase family protein, partial [Defluviitaleaceae bacterium]|nr:O-antigen ligase family protein [Defluviitaleaceae bacterium]